MMVVHNITARKVIIFEIWSLRGQTVFTASLRVGRIRNGNEETAEMSYKYGRVVLFVGSFYIFLTKYGLLPR